jgi:hypothetical protein
MNKKQVLLASTENINITSHPSTIDNTPINDGDFLIVKNQTDQSENGIYILVDSGLTRDVTVNLNDIIFVYVSDGETHQNTVWSVITGNSFLLEISPVIFIEISQKTLEVSNGIVDTSTSNNLSSLSVGLEGFTLLLQNNLLQANANIITKNSDTLSLGSEIYRFVTEEPVTMENKTLSNVTILDGISVPYNIVSTNLQTNMNSNTKYKLFDIENTNIRRTVNVKITAVSRDIDTSLLHSLDAVFAYSVDPTEVNSLTVVQVPFVNKQSTSPIQFNKITSEFSTGNTVSVYSETSGASTVGLDMSYKIELTINSFNINAGVNIIHQ